MIHERQQLYPAANQPWWSVLTMEKSDRTHTLSQDGALVSLTYDHLDMVSVVNSVRSAKAGATVLFAGNFCSPALSRTNAN